MHFSFCNILSYTNLEIYITWFYDLSITDTELSNNCEINFFVISFMFETNTFFADVIVQIESTSMQVISVDNTIRL